MIHIRRRRFVLSLVVKFRSINCSCRVPCAACRVSCRVWLYVRCAAAVASSREAVCVEPDRAVFKGTKTRQNEGGEEGGKQQRNNRAAVSVPRTAVFVRAHGVHAVVWDDASAD